MNDNTMEKIAEQLAERIGEITKSYEIQLASLRTSAEAEIQRLQGENTMLRQSLDELNNRLESYNDVGTKEEG